MKYSKKKSIVFIAMLLILSLCFLAGCNSGVIGGESGSPGNDIDGKPSADTFKVIADESKNIEYEEYDNGYVTMDIPKGWKFILNLQADTVHYTFQVVNPQNKEYQIYFGMKSEGFLSTEKERHADEKNGDIIPLVAAQKIEKGNIVVSHCKFICTINIIPGCLFSVPLDIIHIF